MKKFEKVMDHTYTCGDWKIYGMPFKDNPTRSLYFLYFVSYKGVHTKFSGTLAQAKNFVRTPYDKFC